MNVKSIVERYGMYSIEKKIWFIEMLDVLKMAGCDVPHGKEVKEKWEAKVKREGSAVRISASLNAHRSLPSLKDKKENTNTMSVQEHKDFIHR